MWVQKHRLWGKEGGAVSVLGICAGKNCGFLVRALPEEVGLPFFLISLWPTLAVIAVPVAASMVRVIQTRSPRALPSLILSMLAVGLFYINSTTPWIWPYRTP